MKRLDIHGVIRGKVKKTTVPDKGQPCPKDSMGGEKTFAAVAKIFGLRAKADINVYCSLEP